MSTNKTPDLKKPWTFDNPICAQVGGEMFYSADLDDPNELDSNISNVQEARKICSSCSHQEDCANWGIYHERFGIWGGLSPKDLVKIRQKRNIIVETVTLFSYIEN